MYCQEQAWWKKHSIVNPVNCVAKINWRSCVASQQWRYDCRSNGRVIQSWTKRSAPSGCQVRVHQCLPRKYSTDLQIKVIIHSADSGLQTVHVRIEFLSKVIALVLSGSASSWTLAWKVCSFAYSLSSSAKYLQFRWSPSKCCRLDAHHMPSLGKIGCRNTAKTVNDSMDGYQVGSSAAKDIHAHLRRDRASRALLCKSRQGLSCSTGVDSDFDSDYA